MPDGSLVKVHHGIPSTLKLRKLEELVQEDYDYEYEYANEDKGDDDGDDDGKALVSLQRRLSPLDDGQADAEDRDDDEKTVVSRQRRSPPLDAGYADEDEGGDDGEKALASLLRTSAPLGDGSAPGQTCYCDSSYGGEDCTDSDGTCQYNHILMYCTILQTFKLMLLLSIAD